MSYNAFHSKRWCWNFNLLNTWEWVFWCFLTISNFSNSSIWHEPYEKLISFWNKGFFEKYTGCFSIKFIKYANRRQPFLDIVSKSVSVFSFDEKLKISVSWSSTLTSKEAVKKEKMSEFLSDFWQFCRLYL